jgi:drug/metabolite transporter (DMT)-like permease
VSAISFAAILFKLAQPTHPLVAAATRLGISAVLLAPLTLRGYRRGRLAGSVGRDAVLAGFLYAVHFGAWVASLELISVAASVTLVTATPVFLALVALITGRDRPTLRHGIAILIALVGVLLIARSSPGAGAYSGNALALLGALAMGLFLLLARRHGASLDAWAFTGVACAVGALVLLVAAVASGVPLALSDSGALLPLAMAALVPQLIGHGCLTWSLRHLKPTTVGLATVAEPVGSTLLAWLWLQEVPTAMTLAGCAVVLVAVVLTLRGERR